MATTRTGHKVSRLKRPSSSQPRPVRIEDFPLASRTDLRIPLYEDALGRPLEVPFIVVRGQHPGPVLGLTAALHGDELNGIKIIHGVLQRVDPELLHGALLCCPVVNVPGFELRQRRFSDDLDLNHVFPGSPEGKPAQQYAHNFLVTFIEAVDYLVDIHTASEGRLNSMYVRADLRSPECRELALLMNPEIVLHVRGGDGTLRNAAHIRDIPAITLEAGNPSVFQGDMVVEGVRGLRNILSTLELTSEPVVRGTAPVICRFSKWLRTRHGGLLETRFGLTDRVARRQPLAEIRDPFGHLRHALHAPHDGVVIGMAASPVAVPGTRVCHLGVVGEPLPEEEDADGEAPPPTTAAPSGSGSPGGEGRGPAA